MSEPVAWLVGALIVILILWELFYGFTYSEQIDHQAASELDTIYRDCGQGIESTLERVTVSVYSYHGGFIWRRRIRHDGALSRKNAELLIHSITLFNLRWLIWSSNPIGVTYAFIHSRFQLMKVSRSVGGTNREGAFVQRISIGSDVSLWGGRIG